MKSFQKGIASLFITCCISLTAAASELAVVAGPDPADIQPVHITVSQDQFWEPLSDGSWQLVNGDETVPLQVIRRNVVSGMGFGGYGLRVPVQKLGLTSKHVWELFFVVEDLQPYEKRVYQILEADTSEPRVSVAQQDGKIVVQAVGKPYTEYLYDVTKEQPRPILFPVHGPNGAEMTRGYPMKPAKEAEKKDHPHHQSLWVSHGDVNNVNFWHLGDEQGYQRHDYFAGLEEGPVVGRIEAELNWENEEGNHVVKERRAMTFWAPNDDVRMIDVDSIFIADSGDVTFGDTKEGGLLSLRVAGTLKEEYGQGGTITNSNGEVGAGEAWGKAAPWCDYSGPVEGQTAGLTIMEHPENPFYPTRYHVRDYGLFTANPFGLSYFLRDKEIDGSRTLQYGNSWRFRYRVYLHPGDVESGNVAAQYNAYAGPPRVILR